MILRHLLLSFAVVLTCVTAHAQSLREQTAHLKRLEFRPGTSELGLFSSISNAIFRPEGKGPYPVVVIGHTCGGVGQPHIRDRMRELLDAGFAVLPLDTFGQRGITQCRNQTKVPLVATVMDAYHALEHLDKVAEIDKSRVYFTGYSWGGFVAPLLASPRPAEAFGAKLRYRAIVSNYGACSWQDRPDSRRNFFLLPDTDRPLLMLMASEDKEGKVSDCIPSLEKLKAAGKPVEWHVYPDTHHAWDQRNQTGNERITTGWGEVSVYLYSADATRDSTRRMIEFFNAQR